MQMDILQGSPNGAMLVKYRTVYANDTQVKYLISEASYGSHAITPLYNADGTLQIYDGE